MGRFASGATCRSTAVTRASSRSVVTAGSVTNTVTQEPIIEAMPPILIMIARLVAKAFLAAGTVILPSLYDPPAHERKDAGTNAKDDNDAPSPVQ